MEKNRKEQERVFLETRRPLVRPESTTQKQVTPQESDENGTSRREEEQIRIKAEIEREKETLKQLNATWSTLSIELAGESYTGLIDERGTNWLRKASSTAKATRSALSSAERAILENMTTEARRNALSNLSRAVFDFESVLAGVQNYRRDLKLKKQSVSDRNNASDSADQVDIGETSDDTPIPLATGILSVIKPVEEGLVICKDPETGERYAVEYQKTGTGNEWVRGKKVEGHFDKIGNQTRTVVLNNEPVFLPLVRWSNSVR